MSLKKEKSKKLTNEEIAIIKGIINYKSEFTNDMVSRLFDTPSNIVSETLNSGRVSEIKSSMKDILTEEDKKCSAIMKAKLINMASLQEVEKFLEEKSSNIHEKEEFEIILQSAREAMIMAVTIFNNPSYVIKSEGFPVFSVIAWTRLLQSYATKNSFNYEKNNNEVQSLSYMLSVKDKYKLSEEIIKNIEGVIKIRNEVEHRYLKEDFLGWHMLYQANCLNFENIIVRWFGEKYSLAENLKFSLQFCKMTKNHLAVLSKEELPEWINSINHALENVSEDILNSTEYLFQVAYIPIKSSKGIADTPIRFVSESDSNYQDIQNVLVKSVWREGKTINDFLTDIKKTLQINGYKISSKKMTWRWLNSKVLIPYKVRDIQNRKSLNEKFCHCIKTGEKAIVWQYSNEFKRFILEEIEKKKIILP